MQRHRGLASTWILTDGHAGNLRQARALATALGRDAREWELHPRAPWKWFAPRCLPRCEQAFGRKFRQSLGRAPGLAIGCGRQAALATRLLRERGARAVQILDPRADLRHWDLVVAPAHDALHAENVIALHGSLNPVDDLWLAAARATFPELGQWPRPRTALLVGGPSAHARFEPARAVQWLEEVAALVRGEGGSVLATSSRRTPPEVAAHLRDAFAALPGLVWTDPGDGPNPYAGMLGWADRIVCTADSVNMLSEAAATHAPLFVLGLDALGGRPRRFLDELLRDRARRWSETAPPYPVHPLRETARVADEVASRLKLG